jgi:hypothetical protein
MAKTKMVRSGEKTLAYSTPEFESYYIDELAEECAHFVWLVAKLRKLPAKEECRARSA